MCVRCLKRAKLLRPSKMGDRLNNVYTRGEHIIERNVAAKSKRFNAEP